MISPESLGCDDYKRRHGINYAYATGGMYHGIASKELVIAMANSGFMGFFGAGGLSLETIEEAILFLKNQVYGTNYGINILHNHIVSAKESAIVDLLLKHGIRNAEAASFATITPEIVRYRLSGIFRAEDGSVTTINNVMAKVSRIEVARVFMSPAPENIIEQLLKQGKITTKEAAMSREIPVANEICVEAESAGHTDRRSANIVLPTIIKLRDALSLKYEYSEKICVGSAGGIGTPESAAAAFVMGADFILTGSINQCTTESAAHSCVKEMLSKMGTEDTEFTPTGDMFETDAKIQVLRKGLLFPVRAKKLHELYNKYSSLDELSVEERDVLINKIFNGKSFDEVFDDAKIFFPKEIVEKAEEDPKVKMGLIFKVYFYLSIKNAYSGNIGEKINFQIHIGPAMGAFNDYVAGTELEEYTKRSAPKIAKRLLEDTALRLNAFYESFKKHELIPDFVG